MTRAGRGGHPPPLYRTLTYTDPPSAKCLFPADQRGQSAFFLLLVIIPSVVLGLGNGCAVSFCFLVVGDPGGGGGQTPGRFGGLGPSGCHPGREGSACAKNSAAPTWPFSRRPATPAGGGGFGTSPHPTLIDAGGRARTEGRSPPPSRRRAGPEGLGGVPAGAAWRRGAPRRAVGGVAGGCARLAVVLTPRGGGRRCPFAFLCVSCCWYVCAFCVFVCVFSGNSHVFTGKFFRLGKFCVLARFFQTQTFFPNF